MGTKATRKHKTNAGSKLGITLTLVFIASGLADIYKSVQPSGTAVGATVGTISLAVLAGALYKRYKTKKEKKVAIVRFEGVVEADALTSADKVVPALKDAFDDEQVDTLILSIDSPGGSPIESERISDYIEKRKAETGKKVLAVINGIGASAAYALAIHADEIIAGRSSLVGSIGAIVSTWDAHKLAERLEVEAKVFASGPLKSGLHPFIKPTPEAEEKYANLVTRAGQEFAAEVTAARKDKLKPHPGQDLFTGEVWLGTEALELGLVDELNTLDVLLATRFAEHKVEDFTFSPNYSLLYRMTHTVSEQVGQSIVRATTNAGAVRLR